MVSSAAAIEIMLIMDQRASRLVWTVSQLLSRNALDSTDQSESI